MEGATLESVAIGPPMMGVWPVKEHTSYDYVVSGELDEVMAGARRELTAKKGWDWLATPSGVGLCEQNSGSEYISFSARWQVLEDDPPFVTVTISHETSTVDRLRQWLHDR